MEKSRVERNKEMKRYLYCEMDVAEQISVEDRMFEDDSYSNDLEMLEDELIHQYARNELVGNEKTRFEQSLLKVKTRRAKVTNAMALQSYIVENEQLIAPFLREDEPEKRPFFVIIKEFFKSRGFSTQLTLGSLALLLAVGLAVVLTYRNYQITQENARLQKENAEQTENLYQLEKLQARIDKIDQQESELNAKSTNITERENDLTKKEELIRGKFEILRQRESLAKEIRQNREKQTSWELKTTTALAFFPSLPRGVNKPQPKLETVKLKRTDTRVKVTFPFLFEGYSIELNDGEPLKSRRVKNSVVIVIPRKRLKNGEINNFVYKDAAGNPIIFPLKVIEK